MIIRWAIVKELSVVSLVGVGCVKKHLKIVLHPCKISAFYSFCYLSMIHVLYSEYFSDLQYLQVFQIVLSGVCGGGGGGSLMGNFNGGDFYLVLGI